MLDPDILTARDIIRALAWLFGISTIALGSLVWFMARALIVRVNSIKDVVRTEMRAFDVRLTRLETLYNHNNSKKKEL